MTFKKKYINQSEIDSIYNKIHEHRNYLKVT